MTITGGWLLVLITTPSEEEAEAIAKAVVEEKLAACVNIVDGVKSFFWWEGRVDEASEALLIVKTRASKLPRLVEVVKKLHSYSVPEIIAVPIVAGFEQYMNWLDNSIESSDVA